jgi:hypothetical protein
MINRRVLSASLAAKTIKAKASHLSMISRPAEITNLILEAAGVRGAPARGDGG